jgi:CRP-like cAMP-binding protein
MIKPVIMFNEVTVIDQGPNPVTAIANIDSATWKVSPENYHELMRRYPEVGIGLLKILAERNRLFLARYEDLMSRPVLARTAKLLYSLSECGQQPINRYDHPNQRIAALAGTVPEAISRSIKILKDNNVVECTRSQIKILSTEALTDFALVEPTILEYKHPS